VAPDGSVRSAWWDLFANGAKWNAPFDIAPAGSARPGTSPAAAARQANHLDVFWAGPDGSVRSAWWDLFANGANWNAPFDIAPAGSARPGTSPAAAARQANHLDVFWAGPDGSVRSAWWDLFANGAKWNAPFNVAPPGSA
jgi:hypothetical protein